MEIFILCLEVFLARIIDVSIGVVRTIELVNNHTKKAVVLAFFEVFIWFMVARTALTNADAGILIAICYSLGYATGTLVGSLISKKFINTPVGVQVVTLNATEENIHRIKEAGYGISKVPLEDSDRKMLFIETKSTKLDDLLKLIKEIDKDAFVFVNENKRIINGYF